MIKDYIKCGITGWCLEIIWTGFCSLVAGNYCLTATTSLWMFFIYGLAVFIRPIARLIKDMNIVIRGGTYMILFFIVEYISGMFLKHFYICPWDYSCIPNNVCGVIRPDYAILWFIAGLIYEHILTKP